MSSAEVAYPTTSTVRKLLTRCTLGVAVFPADVVPHSAHEAPDLRPCLGRRAVILLTLEIRQLAPEMVPMVEPLLREIAAIDRLVYRAPRFTGMLAIAEATLRGQRVDVRKG